MLQRMGARPDASRSKPERPGPQAAGHERSRTTNGLPGAAASVPARIIICSLQQIALLKSLCASSVRSVPLWWNFWLLHYDYQPILIAMALAMFAEYIKAAMDNAVYEIIDDPEVG